AVVIVQRDADLLEVVRTRRAVGGLAHLLDGGHQQADEDGNDGDHHQQLDQRETGPTSSCRNHGRTLSWEENERRIKGRILATTTFLYPSRCPPRCQAKVDKIVPRSAAAPPSAWIQARRDQRLPHPDAVPSVELKQVYRHASHGRPANDAGPLQAEMFAPP